MNTISNSFVIHLIIIEQNQATTKMSQRRTFIMSNKHNKYV